MKASQTIAFHAKMESHRTETLIDMYAYRDNLPEDDLTSDGLCCSEATHSLCH